MLEKVESTLDELGLHTMSELLSSQCEQSLAKEHSYLEFLEALLTEEIEERKRRSFEIRMKTASFPFKKTLDEFDFSWVSMAMRIPHRRPREFPTDGHWFSPGTAMRIPHGRPLYVISYQPASGVTPFPEVASTRRIDSPEVTITWAWCNSRSTSADAMVLSISWSNPDG